MSNFLFYILESEVRTFQMHIGDYPIAYKEHFILVINFKQEKYCPKHVLYIDFLFYIIFASILKEHFGFTLQTECVCIEGHA